MADDAKFTVLVVPEGGRETRTYRLSPRGVKLAAALAGMVGLVIFAMAASWSYLAARAARVGELEAEIARLEKENEEVRALSRQLADLEERYEQIRALFGSGTAPAATGLWLPSPSGARGGREAAADRETSSRPTSWPLTERGFVTQRLLEGGDGDHPGLDIAVPTDSYVRASGAGKVVEVGEDPVYGKYVVIDHADGYRSLYAHASMTLVEIEDYVRRHEVIALSGSTGRSSAPHLHFEVSKDGEPVDPMTLVSPR